MSMPQSPAAPTLPIKNRSTVTAGGGRTPKKGGSASSKNREGAARGGHKSWADFTPGPWLDYGSTPWSNTAGAMPPYGQMFAGKEKGKKDAHGDLPGAWPSTPTPTPKSWGATPTPSSAGSLPQACFMPNMMGSLPFMQPGFAAMAQMAEVAAAAAAGAAAAATAAAGHHAHQGDSSPEKTKPPRHETYSSSDAHDSPPYLPPPLETVSSGPPPAHTISSLASKGSAIHGTGKCRPCAWFWKQTGCQCGTECNYCHMCPEGELKNRKKMKVAAMRMGALVPATTGSERSGAPRTLKLTSLV
mmetsp:Transcript_5893/g.11973  ORF Transcript_5893/g.11973 Transcript_5893/m.11973 type:complete len:301 (-) Transcript_5893:154-1056(-)|eukprot:CAMPEP_0170284934 /NCGR_PEP_ID=MMETSP0116_2-20130129/42507_1 /TAXON_ID=400756 /ORGANISM="Durinskia baltica, Strain CSIRO CS-38" /LENGTH=300 /DNA_ID=CAMNT_0010536317 /DNA_START=75 /DNA_END=977 /DNA_ORIENTATION=+